MIFYMCAGFCFFMILVIIFGILRGVIDKSLLPWMMFLFVMCGLSTYLFYQGNIDDAQRKQITTETNISSITNFVFTKETANKIDNQAEKNATCSKEVCVYVGKITPDGPMYKLTLLTQQNIVFECTVQNRCKLSSYIEHGAKYLKISTN